MLIESPVIPSWFPKLWSFPKQQISMVSQSPAGCKRTLTFNRSWRRQQLLGRVQLGNELKLSYLQRFESELLFGMMMLMMRMMMVLSKWSPTWSSSSGPAQVSRPFHGASRCHFSRIGYFSACFLTMTGELFQRKSRPFEKVRCFLKSCGARRSIGPFPRRLRTTDSTITCHFKVRFFFFPGYIFTYGNRSKGIPTIYFDQQPDIFV